MFLFCAASMRWAGLNYRVSHSTAQLAAPQSLSTQFSMAGLLCSILTRTNALEVQTANILSSTGPPIVPRIPSLADMGLRLYRFPSMRASLERAWYYTAAFHNCEAHFFCLLANSQLPS